MFVLKHVLLAHHVSEDIIYLLKERRWSNEEFFILI